MQSPFHFDVNEEIAFHHDQKIKEMLGIGLEPVMSVEELDDTLSIRGVMELKGEYVKDEDLQDRLGENDNRNLTYVERVDSVSESVCEFFHKLLVDITIPMDRVASPKDVSVEVDYFDYQLPSDQEMKIEATLAIYGLTEEHDDESLEAFTNDREGRLEDGEFEFVVEEQTEGDPKQQQENEENILSVSENRESEEEEEKWSEEVYEEQTGESISDGRIMDEAGDDMDYSDEQNQEELELAKQEGAEQDFQDEITREEEYLSNDPETPIVEEDDELEEEPVEEVIQLKSRSEASEEDSSYLLNIFTDEEESAYSRLKLYIVQPSDHMNEIAEKYGVSARQIMRTNRLDDEDITPGQLIYIPISIEE
ncbi:stage VI sporulation protein D [Gracilibacillus sp. YIM 98692]|uniref:stage VI sporulation protein D n=1 Tax=Gracilibacillus sp. YIM 98692 TaxID=2663532 RepID=UPI0013D36998|nr:stage VI sporulation protein D [Gracilibacillus sp. YIM 98692]